MTAQRAALPGDRLHFSHGPIDLVIGAEGDPSVVQASHAAAWARFEGLLAELVGELAFLRAPVGEACPLSGPVAQRMWRACHPYRAGFVTPMAAVAGSVAEEIVAAYLREGIARAWVNNGGDIALHLAPGASLRVGLFADLARLRVPRGLADLDGALTIHARSPVRGIATSGWRGRSFSLGIADSVTVLARTAAQADAAATIVANAVDVPDPGIERRPACELKDDSDLGDIPVTVHVPALAPQRVQAALRAGLARASALQAAGLLEVAVLVCQGQAVATGAGDGHSLPGGRASPPDAGARDGAGTRLALLEPAPR